MEDIERSVKIKSGPPIFVISGGTGATGELLARTVLAQFRDVNVPLIVESHINDEGKAAAIVAQAAATGGTILHTMVKDSCREGLIRMTRDKGIFAFDLAGPLLQHLSEVLGQTPLGVPGLYRQLHRAYFDRVEAIEFAVAHDDGKRPEDLSRAEIVLVGVSRVGKTPLSMYLSVLGWKVANVPFVFEVPLPEELSRVDKRRIVGLMIEPSQLIVHRKWRQQRTGIPDGAYIQREEIIEELRAANHYFHRQGLPVVDTTNKPIETSADEVVGHVTRRLSG